MLLLLRVGLAYLLTSSLLLADGFLFIAGGDVPYGPGDAITYRMQLEAALALKPRLLAHVGDIKDGGSPCTDLKLEEMRELFRSLPVPMVYTPGDNEWTDCHRNKAGAYDPLERLGRLRTLFFGDPNVLRLAKLGVEVPDPAYPEQYRFSQEGVLFATLHLVGSHNNRRKDDPQAMAEFKARTKAMVKHLRQTFAQARQRNAPGLVLIFHADPLFERDQPHAAYEDLIETLRKELRQWSRPVLAIHGDSHTYLLDRPLRNPATGAAFAQFTRLEVPGAPLVQQVLVAVDPAREGLFRISPFDPERGAPAWDGADAK